MRICTCLLLFSMLASTGCAKKKTTDELIQDLTSSNEKDRIISIRTVPLTKETAPRVMPLLIETLKDKDAENRKDAANRLGVFGENARDAIPALKELAQNEKDPRVLKAARSALSRIEKQQEP